ncbi:hypothetical protein CG478_000965 [Bacillus cytotoxicus]|uniref:hypothetical protein n=1 Tax=Bacillus cytotoxicus TaxID=580165 RepID=UPI000B974C15|nr:hypothetical protein [Bacillus cytotoxicus]AWC27144.1 hypothetical protein CG483_000965 [Bacillus cytotoxicus]AWC39258.1 hypothetical protein CG480_000965 [Bacillus cytotoxicus]AWC47189.1 hypothetical protein CG478_000965 [Bacillus cytotoxicus]AWC51210.1 hypothetical protein CG477_000965 [Bacillus cytotoxicus]AWC55339.1 hypothetical protein CG476_000965 [Bacillus cytotoxicus]
MANMIDIIVNATDNASREIEGVNRALESLERSGMKASGVLAGLAGSIGALAPAVAGVGALTASFASAGIGAVAFGAVATSSISKVVDASEEVAKIEEKIAQADTTKERIAAQKELAQVMAGMSTAQKGALSDLKEFKSWWGDFTASFDTPVFKVFGESMKLVQNTMTALQPAIMSVGNVLGSFLEKLNASFKTDQVKSFFDYINGTAGANLQAFLSTTGNLFVGFFEILKAFAPLSSSFNQGMVSMSASFRKWAEGLSQSQGFQNFINYVKTNTPPLLSLIGNLASFIGKVVVALAPLGTVVLGVASSFMSWINSSGLVNGALSLLSATGQLLANNMGLVKVAVIAVALAMARMHIIAGVVKAVQMGITIFQNLVKVINLVKTAFTLLRVVFLTNPFGIVILAITALIAIGVALYKNWDTVKAKTQQLWSTLVNAFNNIKSAVAQWASDMTSKFNNAMNNAKQAVSNGVKNIVSFFVNLASQVASKVSSMASKAQSLFTNMMSRAKSAVQSGISAVVSFFGNLASQVVSKISSLGSQLASKFTSMMSSARSAVSNGVNNIVSAIKNFASTFLSAGKGLLEAFTKGIKNGISNAISAVKSGMSKIRDFLPFSPAKKGALSDLDKSGESFFPTFAGGMASGLRPMLRMAEKGMGELSSILNEPATQMERLQGFNLGRTSITVVHRHEHSGEVEVRGDNGNRETLSLVGNAMQKTTESDIMSGLRQAIRKR